MSATLTYEGLTLGGSDAYGTTWTLAEEDGWFAGPAMRTQLATRPGANGGFPARSLTAPRSWTLTGLVLAPSEATLLQSIQAFAAAGTDGDEHQATWIDALGERYAQAARADAKVEVLTDVKARYQLTLAASDPRKYGGLQTVSTGLLNPGSGGLTYPLTYLLTYGTAPSGGLVTLDNPGTAPTEPLIIVSGPLLAGFLVTHVESGRALSYINSAGAIELDSHAGTATEEGQDRTRWLMAREWFQVGPGESARFSFSTLGTETAASVPAPMMTVQMAPAYW